MPSEAPLESEIPAYNDGLLTAEQMGAFIQDAIGTAPSSEPALPDGDSVARAHPVAQAEAVAQEQAAPEPPQPDDQTSLEMIAQMHESFAEQALAGPDAACTEAAVAEIEQAIAAESAPEPVEPHEVMQNMYDLQHMLMMNPEMIAVLGMMPGPGPG